MLGRHVMNSFILLTLLSCHVVRTKILNDVKILMPNSIEMTTIFSIVPLVLHLSALAPPAESEKMEKSKVNMLPKRLAIRLFCI